MINAPGAGAAGGMGAALLGLLNAELRAGVEIVVETLQLEQAVKDADLVITGEGRLDSQSICGKTPIGVARVAKRYHKPVIALAVGCNTIITLCISRVSMRRCRFCRISLRCRKPYTRRNIT